MKDVLYIPAAEMARLQVPLEAFATALRLNTLALVTRAGSGHLGASFSALDLMVWLHLRVMGPRDVFILSKGHAAAGYYALLAALGTISDRDALSFRQPGGLPGHPHIGIPGVACNTGSLGMGLSKAKGMALADRVLGVPERRHFVLMGDGELQEGQVWESLLEHTGDALKNVVLIVDCNSLQSTGVTTSVRPSGDVPQRLASCGWNVFHAGVHGHAYWSLQELEPALDGTHRVAILANTTKGKGVSFMENAVRWHSATPTREEYAKAVSELLSVFREGHFPMSQCEWLPCDFPERVPDALVAAYGEALAEAGEREPRLVVLDSDLATDYALTAFAARFPERFFECGIAEQDMVSIASGMAARGLLPVCHSHAAFLTRRAHDQIYNQVSERTRVIYVGGSAGLLPAHGSGKSHEALHDREMMAGLGMLHFEPRNPRAVASMLDRCINADRPAYLRLLKRWQ